MGILIILAALLLIRLIRPERTLDPGAYDHACVLAYIWMAVGAALTVYQFWPWPGSR